MRIATLAPVALLILGAWAGTASAKPESLQITLDGTTPVNWRWIAAPDGTQVASFLREQVSQAARSTGMAKLECAIGKDQHVGDCKVLEETAGANIGEAIMHLTHTYKAASKDAAGAPTVGHKVYFTYDAKS
ncbi:MAG: hypothetical protein JSR45_06590 [Proteobacteria bacterium]|nr:hypothetical protein [Pseudomonadota bacterium]